MHFSNLEASNISSFVFSKYSSQHVVVWHLFNEVQSIIWMLITIHKWYREMIFKLIVILIYREITNGLLSSIDQINTWSWHWTNFCIKKTVFASWNWFAWVALLRFRHFHHKVWSPLHKIFSVDYCRFILAGSIVPPSNDMFRYRLFLEIESFLSVPVE